MTRIAVISFFSLTLAGALWFIWSVANSRAALPVIGEAGHTAGTFSFENQDGQTITEKDVSGKVTVVEYFFTTCPGICKIMNSNLTDVYTAFKQHKDFAILSHTVDPEKDSVRVLAEYAGRMHAATPAWQFLTGSKKDLYYAAREDYMLAVEDTVIAVDEDFIHTEYVALVDRQRRIRGFYDATNKDKVKQLIEDIRWLLKE